MRRPEIWLLVVLVCAGLMGRFWAVKSGTAAATPTPLPTALERPSPMPSPLLTPSPIVEEVEIPQETDYHPPPQAFQPPSNGLPKDVLANGWDGYDANELAHAARNSSGSYYVAAASRRNFYAAFESGGRWRLFQLRPGQQWRPLGEAVEHQKPGWPGGRELDRMGAGQIPEKTWRALRGCPAIRFYPVTD